MHRVASACTCATCLGVVGLEAGGRVVRICPRCAYMGPGLGYFSRGRNVAKLVGIGFLTSGIVGLGGLAYYLVRKNDLLCPCCGAKWGTRGERALARTRTARLPLDDASAGDLAAEVHAPGGAGRGFFIAAIVMLLVGLRVQHASVFVLAVVAAVAGYFAHRSELARREVRRRALLAALQPAVLALARRSGGRLTVTDVAAGLQWPLPRAEKVLQSLDDGMRVDSTVSDEGVIVYEFREVLHSAASRAAAIPRAPAG